MSNQFKEIKWSMLVGAATRALRSAGLAPKRVPGRGRSNIWEVEERGRRKRVSIRTTKDRWFAFALRKKAITWKTLDDVDIVIVAAVDDLNDPRKVEVYRFDAEEVRKRFNASYAARIDAGQKVRDGFGMWLNLDEDDRGLPASVGAGLATAYPPITTFRLEELIAEINAEPAATSEDGYAAGADVAVRIDEEALARWKEAAGGELDDNAAANAAVRMAADAQGREVAAEALGMQRLAAWVADGHADPAALVAGDVEVTVADNLEIRARIGDARFILAQNPVSARRRVVTAANEAAS